MSDGIVARGIQKVRKLLAEKAWSGDLSERQRAQLRAQLQECAEALGGEVSARQRAARLAETYSGLSDAGRAAFLRLIATEFGPQPARVAKAHEAYQAALGTDAQWAAESALRAALRSPRLRILTQFNAWSPGVKFLVDLRADLIRYSEVDPVLRPLDRELESRLAAWFDVGFLELQRITWNSPAALLEKLITYEAVHAIRSWEDLKNRLDSDRRCYAFFHPRMPMEPLIFVEVALVDELAGSVQALLDEQAPVFDAQRATTAIFYSISNTQVGLRGVSFGNFLLKRVIEDLQRDFPRLEQFATLSPIPGLRRWVEKHPQEWATVFDADLRERLARHLPDGAVPSEDALRALLADGAWAGNERLARALQPALTRLAARYFLHAKAAERGEKGGEPGASVAKPFDPVARFHLGNGARVERINPLGDTSPNGFKQSYGLMVNYLYDPDGIEANVEAFARAGNIAASGTVRRAGR